MRRKDDGLRDTLLAAARETADREGMDAVNIRAIAKRAGVAGGTVYNYFSGKDEILLALTEEYWIRTLEEMGAAINAGSFCGQLKEIFEFLKERIDRSAGKLMNSLGAVEARGQERMAAVQSSLQAFITERMERDEKVRARLREQDIAEEKLARFILRNMMQLLKEGGEDFPFFLSVVERIVGGNDF